MGIISSKKSSRSSSPSLSNLSDSSLSQKEPFPNQDDSDQIYPFKRSQLEQMELWQLHHNLSKDTWGDHFIAPINEWLKIGGVKVLDMGCGSATWLNDVALEYPLSKFFGVDIQPLIHKRLPSNVEIIQADIKYKLPFAENTFDFIHMRHMILFFTEQEWSYSVIPELIRILKPGGYLELAEADIEWYNVSPTTRLLISAAHNIMRQRGIDPFIVNRIYDILHSTEDLTSIYHKIYEAPIGKWAKHGEKLLYICSRFFATSRIPQCKILKISEQQFDEYLNQFEKDVEIFKTYCKSHRFYAAKKFI
ncbi:S-adenosyl-L-methionine-dependent methyltransferase [Glomus cerebriforme]|uniref:S-adenosyl-L-methionine-dependent methyltransferase n=1 Tax=Glomus cerebriforme TaxID=658196 RepID=A0A397SAV7_9GLOM|nr:S-adenosyl-L-methionine-dependent methyltransferase [Glomus cerebriforme]